MTYGDNVLDFFYDINGVPIAMRHGYASSANYVVYYYITNLQGDVIRLVDVNGNTAAYYEYDPYGNAIQAAGSHANVNPLRYRGYVYDTDTGLYYLQSRYYDPKVGRFLNADAFASTGQGIISNNMYVYCLNNPVRLVDSSGNEPVEAVDTDGDGDIDYYAYEYTYTYAVYLPNNQNLATTAGFEVTGHGTVYFFPIVDVDLIENPPKTPDSFNKLTDLQIVVDTRTDNVNFHAINAHLLDVRMRGGIVKTMVQFDKDMQIGHNRTVNSLRTEWFWHMFLGGRTGLIKRLSNVDFDSNAEGMEGKDYISLALKELFG